MNTVYIYTLTDPRSGEVRYIGKTNNLKVRMHNHLNSCRDKNTHKRNWINQLRKQGLLPTIEVLDEVVKSEWKQWEKYWIRQMRCWGFKLVNYTEGGDGLTFGNQTSFKIGLQPWNKGLRKTKPIKPHRGKSPNTVKHQFQSGCVTWNKGLKGIKLKPDKNIHQYSGLTGDFIKTWNNAKEASVSLSLNKEALGQCARGKTKTSGGFIWQYYKSKTAEPVKYTGKTNNKIKTKLK